LSSHATLHKQTSLALSATCTETRENNTLTTAGHSKQWAKLSDPSSGVSPFSLTITNYGFFTLLLFRPLTDLPPGEKAKRRRTLSSHVLKSNDASLPHATLSACPITSVKSTDHGKLASVKFIDYCYSISSIAPIQQ